MHPKPSRNDSTSSTVIARSAGTVSDSSASHARSTRRAPSSGSHLSTGSDSAIAPSSISSIAATPVTGLVIDAIRKIASRPIGALSPSALCPAEVTCTCPSRATSAASPGTAPVAVCFSQRRVKRGEPLVRESASHVFLPLHRLPKY